ncbi:MAG TPA: PLP-dependent aminotransferase family protein [Candidatus Eubacterium faecipullorum]|uniref:PLP-dependent aminotransferase family protein n=1 Tax=Candidatus Eubacterium faecipullorum TaxID=2838571 RepID=A0A9D1RCB7_9FIRM|nr:PLP-dependent aminotransferase family protein [Candidatus Eubacterium faecipullorum]
MSYSLSAKFANLKPSAVREILKVTNEPGMIAFAGGSPDTAAFPCEEVKKLSAEILNEDPVCALVYGVSEGYEPLRKTVKEWLKRRGNIGTDDDVVIITAGGTQVMDITTRVLTSEGDTVICEEPSFIGSLNCFRSHGCKLAGVPIDADGMNMQALERVISENPNAKFIYTIPNFQNPGGTTMSLEKRKKMYELALQNDLVILEDDPYGNLRVAGEDVPAIKSFDTEGIVFYAGSFSKILAPGIRVAYAVIPKRAAGAFTIGKQVSDVHTGVLNQMIVSRWFNEYDVDRHIEDIRKIYKRKLDLMCDCLDEYCKGFITYVRPQGGLFVWAKLPDNVDMLAYVNALLERKVAVVPGSAFMTDDTALCSYIRLNFSTPSDEDIVKGVKIMGEVAEQFK